MLPCCYGMCSQLHSDASILPCPVWDVSRAAQSPRAIFPTCATPWLTSCRLSQDESEMGDKERESLLLPRFLSRLPVVAGMGS